MTLKFSEMQISIVVTMTIQTVYDFWSFGDWLFFYDFLHFWQFYTWYEERLWPEPSIQQRQQKFYNEAKTCLKVTSKCFFFAQMSIKTAKDLFFFRSKQFSHTESRRNEHWRSGDLFISRLSSRLWSELTKFVLLRHQATCLRTPWSRDYCFVNPRPSHEPVRRDFWPISDLHSPRLQSGGPQCRPLLR